MAEKFRAITNSCYADQAKAFLNAYWNDAGADAEQVWMWTHKFIELDIENKAEGTDLDEFNAHRFLESLKEVKTVRQLRQEIKEADMDFNKRIALIEYCLWKYKKSVREFVGIPIGTSEEVEQAERVLQEVMDAFAQADARAAEATAAFETAAADEAVAKSTAAEAKAAEEQALAREAEAREAEAPFKAAQDELNAALAELKAQEDAYNTKKTTLEKQSNEGGVVTRGRAKAALAALLKEDPLPLRRAKITTEAAERKADKVRAPFRVAREAAESARQAASDAAAKAAAAAAEAEESRLAAEAAKVAAEDALQAARAKVEEAEAYLEEVKNRIPKGTAWWLERTLEEKRKYLPGRRK